MPTSIIAVSIGAALGALLRWRVSLVLNSLSRRLPLGTLAINVAGGYLIGLALALFARDPAFGATWRLAIVTGFLGGLTTFSAFSAEVAGRVLDRRFADALSIAIAHVVGSVGMTLLGFATIATFVRR